MLLDVFTEKLVSPVQSPLNLHYVGNIWFAYAFLVENALYFSLF
jgi:hypothetical protein